MSTVKSGSGKVISLGKELGRGGEGSVFSVQGQPNVVAKLYHNPLDTYKQKKLAAMVDLRTDQLLRFATWPIDLLRDNQQGSIIGFLMPALTGKEIHKVYGPKTRLAEFPNANFPFLIHTAANLARAFAALHEEGHVIGDVNHGNFYVSNQGTVMLVDCDSFQISTWKAQYRCEVGVPMYQPPEFQGISSFRDVKRSANHDNFGLAVFIFLLLFMGRHPFSGRYLGSGDMPIEKAIKECRFAYGNTAHKKMMQPPPAALSLLTMPGEVAELFERAFSPSGVKRSRRPTAKQWVQVLETFQTQLQPCGRKEGHHYLQTLRSCPWCEMEKATGIALFPSRPKAMNKAQARTSSSASPKSPPSVQPNTQANTRPNAQSKVPSYTPAHTTLYSPSGAQAVSTFRVETVWAQITAVPSPGPAAPFPVSSSFKFQPSPRVKEHNRTLRYNWKMVLSMNVPVVPVLALWVAYPRMYLFKSALRRERKAASRSLQALRERWEKEAGLDLFTDKWKELEQRMRDYNGLARERKARIDDLHNQQRSRQLAVYLQQYRLEDAKIAGLGSSKKTNLASFGIETAADLTDEAIKQVPGFGPSTGRKLLSWRQSLEKGFVYAPVQTISQSDLFAVDKEIAAKRAKLEQELRDGPAQLKQIADRIKASRGDLWPQVEASAKALAQIEADLRAL